MWVAIVRKPHERVSQCCCSWKEGGRRALWREVLVLAGLCCGVLAAPCSNENFGAKLRLAACSHHPWAPSFTFPGREGEAGSGEEKQHGFFEQSLSKSQWKKKKTRELHPFTTETSQPHPKPRLARDSFLALRNGREPEMGCTGTQRYF